MAADGRVRSELLLLLRLFFVAMRPVPIDVLGFDDLLDALVESGLGVAEALVVSGLVGLMVTVGLALLPARWLLVGLAVELGEKSLVGLLKLLYVGLGVLEEFHFLRLELLDLGLEGLGVEFELLFDLGRGTGTPIFLRISVSCLCSTFSSLAYSSWSPR